MIRHELLDVTFLLVARFDTIIRLENTIMVIDFLKRNFNTNIHLWEFSSYQNGLIEKLLPTDIHYKFVEDTDPILHRTKCINNMVSNTDGAYFAVWDIDVITSPIQVFDAVEYLRNGTDFSFPYRHNFCDTSAEIRQIYFEKRDVNILMDLKPFMNEIYNPNPVGGAFFARRDSYIECGMENENFYGWGIEDGERFARWQSRKKSIKRVDGPIFHLSHPRGINSMIMNEESAIMKKRIYFSTIRGKKWLTE